MTSVRSICGSIAASGADRHDEKVFLTRFAVGF
jgi:hypothetical protein